MPLMGMYKLSQLDPMEADPRNIRIAVRTINALQLQKGDVTLDIGFVSEDGQTNLQERLIVEISQNDFPTKELIQDKKPNETVTIMNLTEQDALKMREFQKLVHNAKANDSEGSGRLGVGISASCLKEAISDQELLVDVFLQVEPNDSYFLILNDLDLLEQKGAEELKNWPVCIGN